MGFGTAQPMQTLTFHWLAKRLCSVLCSGYFLHSCYMIQVFSIKFHEFWTKICKIYKKFCPGICKGCTEGWMGKLTFVETSLLCRHNFFTDNIEHFVYKISSKLCRFIKISATCSVSPIFVILLDVFHMSLIKVK